MSASGNEKEKGTKESCSRNDLLDVVHDLFAFIDGNEAGQVTNMLPPRELADLYRSSRLVYFPMATVGGKHYGVARHCHLISC